MAIAGANARANIWRLNYNSDDEVGGANVTGTVVYYQTWIRIQQNKPEQLLMQQGYETGRFLTATVVPGTLDIREKDELEIVLPLDSIYYGKRFRVVGSRQASHNPRDPRNYIILDLVRSERAHAIQ